MPKFYEIVDANTIRFYRNPDIFDKATVQSEITDVDNVLALDTAEKQLILDSSDSGDSVAQFEAALLERQEKLRDVFDYWSYSTAALNLTVADGMWFSPDSVESFCGEESGNEATMSVDGDTGTGWQHDVDEIHSITLDLGYVKRVEKIRIWLPPLVGARTRLSGVNVFVAKNIDKLSQNQVGSNLSFTVADWNEQALTPHNGRYVRLENIDTDHASNLITIREIELWVVTKVIDL